MLERLTADPLGGVLHGAFVVALLVASVMDLRVRRVPNQLTLALLLLGVLAAASHRFAGTVSAAGLGAIVGLAIWVPFWLLGMLGAGDVKFFAAACAWLGPSLAWRSSLAAAVLGGVMAALVLVRRRGVRSTLEFGALGMANPRAVIQGAADSPTPEAARTFPYAVPMALVLGSVLFFPDLVR